MTQFDESTLDEEVEAVDDETKQDNADEVSDRLHKVEQNQALNALMADPDVLEVIRLKREGKPVSVGEKVAEKSATEDEEVYDEDDPLAETMKRFEGIITKRLSPITDRLESMEQIAQGVQKKNVNDQISKVRDNHADFDTYKESMLALSKDNPGLNVQELYILARTRAGKLDINDPSTFSEKPTTQPRPRRSGMAVAKPSGRQRGKHGFQSMLNEALGKLELD